MSTAYTSLINDFIFCLNFPQISYNYYLLMPGSFPPNFKVSTTLKNFFLFCYFRKTPCVKVYACIPA